MGTQKNSNTLRIMEEIAYYSIFTYLTARNIMILTYFFNMPQNTEVTEYCTNSIYKLSTGQHKIIQIYE